MSASAVLAFAAGVITILSPCVLPLLPLILGSAARGGALRPWGVIIGFIASFVSVTLFLSVAAGAIGLPPDTMRIASGILLMGFGVVLVAPNLTVHFERLTLPLATLSGKIRGGHGFLGGLGIGIGLGMAWTPCVGPIMASAITLAMNEELTARAVAVAIAYASGTALPMTAVIFSGRAFTRRMAGFAQFGTKVHQSFGLVLMASALAILTGWDRSLQGWLLDQFPGWESALTGWEA